MFRGSFIIKSKIHTAEKLFCRTSVPKTLMVPTARAFAPWVFLKPILSDYAAIKYSMLSSFIVLPNLRIQRSCMILKVTYSIKSKITPNVSKNVYDNIVINYYKFKFLSINSLESVIKLLYFAMISYNIKFYIFIYIFF